MSCAGAEALGDGDPEVEPPHAAATAATRSPAKRPERRTHTTARILTRSRDSIDVVTVEDCRAVAEKLPRSYEVLVRGRVKFRVGRIVYLAFSRDQTTMGFAFPKEEREWLIGGSPDKFMHPAPADMRYHWVEARLAALDREEMRGLVEDAWRMVVPKSVAAEYEGNRELAEG